MDELIEGYRRFREDTWPEYRRLFEHLARRGQRPATVVIACSDSRVDPQMIFGAGPGELFVVRNVAALVPPYEPDRAYHGTSAALEFAVRGLQVKNVIVLGHGLCGGISAMLSGIPDTLSDFVAPWMRIADRARDQVLACQAVDPARDQQLEGEHAVIRLSLENLRSFPWIAEREAAGLLTLNGTHFDVRNGELTRMDADGTFRSAA